MLSDADTLTEILPLTKLLFVGLAIVALGRVVSAETVEAKAAVTVTDPLPARVHELVPLQPPPDQPLKVDPDAGVAVRVTNVPLG